MDEARRACFKRLQDPIASPISHILLRFAVGTNNGGETFSIEALRLGKVDDVREVVHSKVLFSRVRCATPGVVPVAMD